MADEHLHNNSTISFRSTNNNFLYRWLAVAGSATNKRMMVLSRSDGLLYASSPKTHPSPVTGR